MLNSGAKSDYNQSKMKGINFIEPMFRAVVEGRKTMTRRVMKPQPDEDTVRVFLDGGSVKVFTGVDKNPFTTGYFKPRYRVGETVYLKEPYELSCDEYGNEVVKYSDGEIRVFKKNSNNEWYYEKK